jgi:SPP1 family predicted phage head-tail adaptor
MSIKAGQLDRHLTILRKEITRKGSGAYTEQPEEFAELWAKKIAGRGREFFEHAETQNDHRVEFMTRYRDDITTDMAVRDDTDGRIYDIESISDEFMRQDELHLFCVLRRA